MNDNQRQRVAVSSEMLAAVLFLAIGATSVILGSSYGLGSASQLGAGAMPVIVGCALIALGVIQLAPALRAARRDEVAPAAFLRSELRPLLLILGAVLAFAVLIVPAGLVPALLVQIAIAWYAQDGGKRWEMFGAMAAVTGIIILIFKYGLGLPLKLWPTGF